MSRYEAEIGNFSYSKSMHECQMSAMQSECSGLLDGATTLVAALHQSQRLLPMCMIVYNLKCFVTDTIH